MAPLKRVFLDTNIYILGFINPNSEEGQILAWLAQNQSSIELIISLDLIIQITRVARRIRNKDWAGEIIDRIWQNYKVRYIIIDLHRIEQLTALGLIPREDIEVYLTAQAGQADCFISANYKLIRALVQDTNEFECLTPTEFVNKYL